MRHWKFRLLCFPLLCWLVLYARAAEPVTTAWLVNPAGNQPASLTRVRPEVHAVTVRERQVEIQSAGISLYYLGPLQTPAEELERVRQLTFRVPRNPQPAKGARTSVRPDVLGVFINGVPLYNQAEAGSYRAQNLWHFDALAIADDGAHVASGRQRATLAHGLSLGLLEQLIADGSRHSPILGYAFDGYPIYGPWGNAQRDGSGNLRRLRSSYRLRTMSRRTHLPDGTALTPSQSGPDVSAEFPLGTFVEDYEFAAGSGDLDECNGRFAVTPEYPQGTYAYFLTTDAAGRLAFPYLLAGKYFGQVSSAELADAFQDSAQEFVAVSAGKELFQQATDGAPSVTLRVNGAALTANTPLQLRFQVRNAQGAPVRFLESVHERPLHLLVISDDLAEFDHIHPVLVAGDVYEITHVFRHGGRYRLYADFTAPGCTQRVEVFRLDLGGIARKAAPLVADETWRKRLGGLEVELHRAQPLRAGVDLELRFTVREAATGKTAAGLEPYLGAWGHFVLLDEARQHFIHAHPLENDSGATPASVAQSHVHATEALAPGPPPTEIRVLTSFPQPGLYKLWAQFQVAGEVLVQPFVLRVTEAAPVVATAVEIPADAVRLTVGARGFQPARISLPDSQAGKPIVLAITRDKQPNCAQQIVFPALGIKQALPLGETVLLRLPALPVGEVQFACGMGMYRGSLVVLSSADAAAVRSGATR